MAQPHPPPPPLPQPPGLGDAPAAQAQPVVGVAGALAQPHPVEAPAPELRGVLVSGLPVRSLGVAADISRAPWPPQAGQAQVSASRAHSSSNVAPHPWQANSYMGMACDLCVSAGLRPVLGCGSGCKPPPNALLIECANTPARDRSVPARVLPTGAI